MSTSYDQITGTTSKTAPDAAGTNNPMLVDQTDPIKKSFTVNDDGIILPVTVDDAVQLDWPSMQGQ